MAYVAKGKMIMSKLSVLQIPFGGFGNGGVSSVILSIIENLHTRFDFTCLVFDEVGTREKIAARYARLYRIRGCYAPHAWYKWLAAVFGPFILYWNVYKLCKKEHFDVIHCHNGYNQWICLLAAKQAGVPLRIAHSHNTNSPTKRNLLKRLIRPLYIFCTQRLINRYATVRLGCSRQACVDFFGSVPAQVICNSVDLKRFDIQKRTPFQSKRFIHVGRFSYEKNQEFIIDIFYLLKKQLPDITLDLVGIGPNKRLLEEQIKRYNLEESIHLLDGAKVNIPAQYAQADYMIFPSRVEGFGIALIEAQAMGIHCFVSEAIQREIDAGLLTFLHLADGPEKWAECVLSHIKQHLGPAILDNKKLREFNPQVIAAQYMQIYEEVIK